MSFPSFSACTKLTRVGGIFVELDGNFDAVNVFVIARSNDEGEATGACVCRPSSSGSSATTSSSSASAAASRSSATSARQRLAVFSNLCPRHAAWMVAAAPLAPSPYVSTSLRARRVSARAVEPVRVRNDALVN